MPIKGTKRRSDRQPALPNYSGSPFLIRAASFR